MGKHRVWHIEKHAVKTRLSSIAEDILMVTVKICADHHSDERCLAH